MTEVPWDRLPAPWVSILVSLKLTQAGQNLFMFVSCHHMAQARMLVNVMEQGPMDEGAFDVVDKLADNFFDQLLKYEICPYKGRIKVQVTTDLNVDVSREYPVYCNQQDRVYKMHYKETKHSEHFWTFEKETKVWQSLSITAYRKNQKERLKTDAIHVRRVKRGDTIAKRPQKPVRLMRFLRKVSFMVKKLTMHALRSVSMMTGHIQ